MLYEGLNGRPGTTIPSSEVHPFIRRRIDEFRHIHHSDADNPNNLVTGKPHGDHPRRHAEVKVVNEMLHDLDRHDFPARVDHERAMKEFVIETQFPNRRTPAPFCANCNHILHGATAVQGRFAGSPPLDGFMESPRQTAAPEQPSFPWRAQLGQLDLLTRPHRHSSPTRIRR